MKTGAPIRACECVTNVDRQVKGVRGTVVGDLLRENASNSRFVSQNNLKESQLEKRVNGLDGEQEVLT
jgi:hypothetical protein